MRTNGPSSVISHYHIFSFHQMLPKLGDVVGFWQTSGYAADDDLVTFIRIYQIMTRFILLHTDRVALLWDL